MIDFAWIDNELIQLIVKTTAGVYVELWQKNKTYDYIADGMIDFIEKKYMWINAYLSMYLFGFIKFFLEGRADRRLLSNIAVDAFDEKGYSLVKMGDELFTHKDGSMIDVFVQSITELQALVEQTFGKVLGKEHKPSQDALSLFYEYESHDALFREHWNSRFEVSFGVRSENQPEVVQLSALSRIDDMLRYELVQMLIRDVPYKRCQSCGKLFIPSGRSDSLYCDRIMPGQDKPCKLVGANLVAKKKEAETPARKLYRQAYQRLNKRVEFGYMEQTAFDAWKENALPKRAACEDGRISIEELAAWLDETSRQK